MEILVCLIFKTENPQSNDMNGRRGDCALSQKFQQRMYYAERQNLILVSPPAIYQAGVAPRRRGPHMKSKNPREPQRSGAPTAPPPSQPAVNRLRGVLQRHPRKLRHEEPDRSRLLAGHAFRHVRAQVLKAGEEEDEETEQVAPGNAAFSQSEDGVGD